MNTRPAVGDPVVYRPHPNAPAEDGVVTRHSADPSLVFVRYTGQHPDAAPKATPWRELETPHHDR